MNSKVIPVILLSVIAVAAGFAFAPVEQAVTVHDDIKDHICVVDNSNSDFEFSSAPEDNGCTDTDD